MNVNIETHVHVVSLDEILQHWQKDYKPLKQGQEIILIDRFVDVAKGKAIFHITTREKN